MITRDHIISYAIKYNGEYKKVYEAIKAKEAIDIIRGVKAITILDDIYPRVLFDLDLPPLVLFYKGDISLIKEEKVAVVGSRKIEDYAKKATIDLVNELKKRYCIVSGLAKGVDSIAHLSALSHKTIGIIGCGIDYIYPKENAGLYEEMTKRHLIISEYPGKVLPLAYHFPFRNRLIAALANKVFVMQASTRSGTLITVNEALNINREVFALPYGIYDEQGKGTNLLIEEGARLIVREDFSKY